MSQKYKLLDMIFDRHLKQIPKEKEINLDWLQKILNIEKGINEKEEVLTSFLNDRGFFNVKQFKQAPKKPQSEKLFMKTTENAEQVELDLSDSYSQGEQLTLLNYKTNEPNEVLEDDEEEIDEDFDPTNLLLENETYISNLHIQDHNYEKNISLIEKYHKNSDNELFSHLIDINTGLVEKIAGHYDNTQHSLDYDDLVSAGKLGLMKAINKFDPSFGYQFSTYAYHWIKQSITRAIMDEGYIIRLPVHQHEKINKLKNAERQVLLSSKPFNTSNICNVANITKDEYSILKQLEANILGMTSLNTIISTDDDNSELLDFINEDALLYLEKKSADYSSPEDLAIQHNVRITLMSLFDGLKDRERKILIQRFGFLDQESKSLEEIGKTYNITRERIRQIEAKAINKIRESIQRKKIDYNDLYHYDSI